MPIVFVHGVAVRREDDPDFEQVSRLTQGTQWLGIEDRLRRYVAPVLRPASPQSVNITQVYWGDLGAHLPKADVPEVPKAPTLDTAARADLLEQHLRSSLPTRQWPELARLAWKVAAQLPHSDWEKLQEELREELRKQLLGAPAEAVKEMGQKLGERLLGERPTSKEGIANKESIANKEPLANKWSLLPRAALPLADRAVSSLMNNNPALVPRHSVRRAMSNVRRPIESFIPIFLGDVMAYLNRRGTPQAPGPIPLRVMQALQEAQAAAPGEALIVVTHSMGGQIMYDLLTAFLPVQAPNLRVDFWCASASQVGLFKELGLFLEDLEGGGEALRQRVDYFWNVWSYADLLSFPARGRLAGVHETAFAQTTNSLRGDHIGYLRNDVFYELLAVKAGLFLQAQRDRQAGTHPTTQAPGRQP